ncbi:unnamed protein product [Amoebophrya sp. A120]|nr:unnamed protein product [Amoebophrya sp. A120]|eukprot:GSA120T00007261001.1
MSRLTPINLLEAKRAFFKSNCKEEPKFEYNCSLAKMKNNISKYGSVSYELFDLAKAILEEVRERYDNVEELPSNLKSGYSQGQSWMNMNIDDHDDVDDEDELPPGSITADGRVVEKRNEDYKDPFKLLHPNGGSSYGQVTKSMEYLDSPRTLRCLARAAEAIEREAISKEKKDREQVTVLQELQRLKEYGLLEGVHKQGSPSIGESIRLIGGEIVISSKSNSEAGGTGSTGKGEHQETGGTRPGALQVVGIQSTKEQVVSRVDASSSQIKHELASSATLSTNVDKTPSNNKLTLSSTSVTTSKTATPTVLQMAITSPDLDARAFDDNTNSASMMIPVMNSSKVPPPRGPGLLTGGSGTSVSNNRTTAADNMNGATNKKASAPTSNLVTTSDELIPPVPTNANVVNLTLQNLTPAMNVEPDSAANGTEHHSRSSAILKSGTASSTNALSTNTAMVHPGLFPGNYLKSKRHPPSVAQSNSELSLSSLNSGTTSASSLAVATSVLQSSQAPSSATSSAVDLMIESNNSNTTSSTGGRSSLRDRLLQQSSSSGGTGNNNASGNNSRRNSFNAFGNAVSTTASDGVGGSSSLVGAAAVVQHPPAGSSSTSQQSSSTLVLHRGDSISIESASSSSSSSTSAVAASHLVHHNSSALDQQNQPTNASKSMSNGSVMKATGGRKSGRLFEIDQNDPTAPALNIQELLRKTQSRKQVVQVVSQANEIGTGSSSTPFVKPDLSSWAPLGGGGAAVTSGAGQSSTTSTGGSGTAASSIAPKGGGAVPGRNVVASSSRNDAGDNSEEEDDGSSSLHDGEEVENEPPAAELLRPSRGSSSPSLSSRPHHQMNLNSHNLPHQLHISGSPNSATPLVSTAPPAEQINPPQIVDQRAESLKNLILQGVANDFGMGALGKEKSISPSVSPPMEQREREKEHRRETTVRKAMNAGRDIVRNLPGRSFGLADLYTDDRNNDSSGGGYNSSSGGGGGGTNSNNASSSSLRNKNPPHSFLNISKQPLRLAHVQQRPSHAPLHAPIACSSVTPTASSSSSSSSEEEQDCNPEDHDDLLLHKTSGSQQQQCEQQQEPLLKSEINSDGMIRHANANANAPDVAAPATRSAPGAAAAASKPPKPSSSSFAKLIKNQVENVDLKFCTTNAACEELETDVGSSSATDSVTGNDGTMKKKSSANAGSKRGSAASSSSITNLLDRRTPSASSSATCSAGLLTGDEMAPGAAQVVNNSSGVKKKKKLKKKSGTSSASGTTQSSSKKKKQKSSAGAGDLFPFMMHQQPPNSSTKDGAGADHAGAASNAENGTSNTATRPPGSSSSTASTASSSKLQKRPESSSSSRRRRQEVVSLGSSGGVVAVDPDQKEVQAPSVGVEYKPFHTLIPCVNDPNPAATLFVDHQERNLQQQGTTSTVPARQESSSRRASASSRDEQGSLSTSGAVPSFVDAGNKKINKSSLINFVTKQHPDLQVDLNSDGAQQQNGILNGPRGGASQQRQLVSSSSSATTPKNGSPIIPSVTPPSEQLLLAEEALQTAKEMREAVAQAQQKEREEELKRKKLEQQKQEYEDRLTPEDPIILRAFYKDEICNLSETDLIQQNNAGQRYLQSVNQNMMASNTNNNFSNSNHYNTELQLAGALSTTVDPQNSTNRNKKPSYADEIFGKRFCDVLKISMRTGKEVFQLEEELGEGSEALKLERLTRVTSEEMLRNKIIDVAVGYLQKHSLDHMIRIVFPKQKLVCSYSKQTKTMALHSDFKVYRLERFISILDHEIGTHCTRGVNSEIMEEPCWPPSVELMTTDRQWRHLITNRDRLRLLNYVHERLQTPLLEWQNADTYSLEQKVGANWFSHEKNNQNSGAPSASGNNSPGGGAGAASGMTSLSNYAAPGGGGGAGGCGNSTTNNDVFFRRDNNYTDQHQNGPEILEDTTEKACNASSTTRVNSSSSSSSSSSAEVGASKDNKVDSHDNTASSMKPHQRLTSKILNLGTSIVAYPEVVPSSSASSSTSAKQNSKEHVANKKTSPIDELQRSAEESILKAKQARISNSSSPVENTKDYSVTPRSLSPEGREEERTKQLNTNITTSTGHQNYSSHNNNNIFNPLHAAVYGINNRKRELSRSFSSILSQHGVLDLTTKFNFHKRSATARERLRSEEGLAALNTHQFYKDKLLWQPAYVYYCVCMSERLSFVELFNHLKRYTADPDLRWRDCVRAKRGCIAVTARKRKAALLAMEELEREEWDNKLREKNNKDLPKWNNSTALAGRFSLPQGTASGATSNPYGAGAITTSGKDTNSVYTTAAPFQQPGGNFGANNSSGTSGAAGGPGAKKKGKEPHYLEPKSEPVTHPPDVLYESCAKDQCYFEGAIEILRRRHEIEFDVMHAGKLLIRDAILKKARINPNDPAFDLNDYYDGDERVLKNPLVRPHFLDDLHGYLKRIEKMAEVNLRPRRVARGKRVQYNNSYNSSFSTTSLLGGNNNSSTPSISPLARMMRKNP